MNRNGEVGFGQRIQLDWLERTANLYAAGHTRDEIEESLQAFLQDRLSIGSDAKRGNRALAISILLKVWVVVPTGLESLRDDGLEFLKQLPPKEHLVVHWGMVMAVYPFFQALAETVGRLLRLQGTVAASQVQRRMREQFGERSTVERAAIASGSASSTLRAITQNPALFPFTTESINIKRLETHGRLELLRQGLDEDVIMLRSGVVR